VVVVEQLDGVVFIPIGTVVLFPQDCPVVVLTPVVEGQPGGIVVLGTPV